MADQNARFFIVGSSRSGSTLLRMLLSAHSRIYIPPETWFVIPLVKQLPLNDRLSEAQVREAVKIITSHHRWPDMAVEEREVQHDVARLNAPRLREIIDLVYARILAKSGKSRLGDKTPPYIMIVPQLASLYPEAKFVHLIRDGRDVAISFVDARFRGRAYHGRRFEWTSAIRQGFQYRESALGERVLEIKYENLVVRLEETLTNICAFLGEYFESSMLHWTLPETAIPARESAIHTKLKNSISESGVNGWQRRLSAFECFLMEASLHRELSRLGYPLSYHGAAWSPLLLSTATILRTASPLLDRAIPFLQRRNLLRKPIYF